MRAHITLSNFREKKLEKTRLGYSYLVSQAHQEKTDSHIQTHQPPSIHAYIKEFYMSLFVDKYKYSHKIHP